MLLSRAPPISRASQPMSSYKELAKRFHALEDEALSGLKGINAVGKLVAHVEDPEQVRAPGSAPQSGHTALRRG